MTKPLGRKAYGSIPHLPTSRLGPGDHHVHEGQARICLEKVRDRHDLVIVQEKLDGSCCAVTKLEGRVLALGRSGYLASSSRFEQHQIFAEWVRRNYSTFDELLNEGERLVGEWLAQAHGTRYERSHADFRPFVPFDLMTGETRVTVAELSARLEGFGELLVPPALIATGPVSLEKVRAIIDRGSRHGGIDPVEGAVWRVERREAVDFLAKWVRPNKVDGLYLPELSGRDAIWHWRP